MKTLENFLNEDTSALKRFKVQANNAISKALTSRRIADAVKIVDIIGNAKLTLQSREFHQFTDNLLNRTDTMSGLSRRIRDALT